MAQRIPIIAILALVTLSAHATNPVRWQLPIAIGDSRFDIYQAIGIPNEIIDYDKMLELTNGESGNPNSIFYFPPEQSNEYFYDRGFFVAFWDDAVFRIVVWGHVDDERGEEYDGPIVNGLTIASDRSAVIKHLGVPDMMRTDPQDAPATDPLLMYSCSYLFWNHDLYQIEVQIANDDHILDADNDIVRLRDSLGLIRFTSQAHIESN